MKEEIKQLLNQITSELGTAIEPAIEIPDDSSHGDYTTNIAMVLAKELKKNPVEIATDFASKFQDLPLCQGFEGQASSKFQVKAVAPGFINFSLKEEELLKTLNEPMDRDPGQARITQGGLEYIENTQPNTNKPLHIGHLRNTALGESIVHLRVAAGHNTKSVNINNDRGIHIIKAMLGYLMMGHKGTHSASESWEELMVKWMKDNTQWLTPSDTSTDHQKPDHFVGYYYVKGDELENGESGEHFKEQAHLMLVAWEDGDPRVRALWEMMNTWFYKGFHETHARFLGIDEREKQFEKEWYESEIYSAGKQLVLDNLDKKLFEKREDGAVIAKLEDYALPDKVVIRKDGTSLYITQDLELIRMRSQEDHATLIAYVVASEQDLQFKQLFTIAEAIGLGKKENFLHISYGMVNLKGGEKMSSRKGTAVNADELMDTLKTKVMEIFEITDEVLAEQIMLGALKYFMLRYNAKAQINFDIDESVSLNGNSGPYLQYAYARTQSILKKAEQNGEISAKVSLSDEEVGLLRKMLHFTEVIEAAAETFSPHVLCTYLYELAQLFNLFYQKQPILKAPEAERALRLKLTEKVGETLQFGLNLLGIPTPEKM